MHGSPRHDTNLRLVLVEEGSRLQGRLTGTYNCDVAAFESAEIAALGRMAYKIGRQQIERRRDPVEVRQPDGDDDTTGPHRLARLERQAEEAPLVADVGDLDRLQLRNNLALDGHAVVGERCDRYGLAVLLPASSAELREGEVVAWREDVGGEPKRLEVHPRRHRPPRFHGWTEDTMFDTAIGEVGGQRQTVRTSADNGDIDRGRGHGGSPHLPNMLWARRTVCMSTEHWPKQLGTYVEYLAQR